MACKLRPGTLEFDTAVLFLAGPMPAGYNAYEYTEGVTDIADPDHPWFKYRYRLIDAVLMVLNGGDCVPEPALDDRYSEAMDHAREFILRREKKRKRATSSITKEV
jgi:hypothetical protein